MNYDEALNAVRSITAKNGADILYEKEQMPSLFRDLAPELTDEYNALKIFYDNELYKAFSETSADDPADCANTINFLKRRLVGEFSVEDGLADEIIGVLTAALGWNTANIRSDPSNTVAGLVIRAMNNKKKLYILLAIGAAVVAAVIILIVALSGGSKGKPQSDSEKATPEARTELPAPENDAAGNTGAAENGVSGNSAADDSAAEGSAEGGAEEGVQIEIPVQELGNIVDSVDDEYKSFEVLPIDSADFFLGKNLRLAATLKDHEMTILYDQNMTANISENGLTMNYKNSDGKEQTLANYVYAAPNEVFKTPGGRNFAIVAFGDHEITEENKEFSTDCFMLVKMRDDVDMGNAKADTYVLLIEDAIPDTYELFKVEE